MKKILLLLLLAASPALAHTKLKSSDPVAGSSVKSPSMIRLNFSEPLEPAFSGAELSDAVGKPIPVPKSVGGTIITLLPFALKPGKYKVDWHAVGHDTHRTGGSLSFTVIK